MPMHQEPDSSRQEILDAAAGLFCEKGYEQTSLADIARAINISQGLCYRYFPSKEALFDAAVDHYAELLAAPMARILQQELPLAEKLDILPVYTAVEQDNGLYSPMVHGENVRKIREQLFSRICARLTPLAVQALEGAKSTGEIGMADTETAAAFCIYGQLGVLTREDWTPEEKSRRVRQFIAYVCNL